MQTMVGAWFVPLSAFTSAALRNGQTSRYSPNMVLHCTCLTRSVHVHVAVYISRSVLLPNVGRRREGEASNNPS